MKGFLKCFYGFGNLGDELLFWGVLDFIDTNYPTITQLTVEVGDVQWMQEWRDRNCELIQRLGLAQGFIGGEKLIEFVSLSYHMVNWYGYDLYFFGGGEVFAESRGFHGGWNYFFRYFLPIVTGRFVLLGGVETAHTWWQKLLYRFVLPKAQAVWCRDQQSYQEVKNYTDRGFLGRDFALPVVDAYIAKLPKVSSSFQLHGPYVLLNLVNEVNTDETYCKIHHFLTELYPDAIPVYVSGKSVNSDDQKFASWLQGAYPQVRIFDWMEYDIGELLALFSRSQAGFAARLHILLLLQAFDKPRHAFVYAEKVKKLIHSTLLVE